MNLQQIFDNGVRGVLAQGCASAVGGQCRYRRTMNTFDDVRCALGHSIPDAKYERSLETAGLDWIAKQMGWEADFDDLRAFQKCHDEASSAEQVGSEPFLEGFVRRAWGFAKLHNLNTEVLD
jgi:hypothetical protein